MSVLSSSYLTEQQVLINKSQREGLQPMAGKALRYLLMEFAYYVNLNNPLAYGM